MRPSNLATKVRSANSTDVKDLDDPSLGAAGSRQISIYDEHAQFRNALAPRHGLAFDGSANAKFYLALTNQAIGSDDFSLSFAWKVPSAPNNYAPLIGLGPNNSPFYTGSAFLVQYDNSGALYFRLFNSSDSSTHCTKGLPGGTISAYIGKWAHVTFVRASTGFTAYLNGVAQTLTDYSSGAVSPNSPVASTYLSLGQSANGGTAVPPALVASLSLYNLALSASDVQEIFELGGSIPQRFQWGSQTLALSETWSSGANGWTALGPASFGGGVANIAGAGSSIYKASVIPGFSRGKTIRVRFDYVTNTLGTGTLLLQSYANTPSPMASDQPITGLSGSGTFDKTFTADTTYVNDGSAAGWQITYATGGWQGTITNLKINWVGAVVHLPLDEGAGYQLRDASSNKLDAAMTTSGISHVIAQRYAAIRTTLVFAGSSNQQLLGQAAVDTSRRWHIASVGGTSSAPVNLSLGNASGGAQYISAQAIPAGDFDIGTFASHLVSGANLWVNSSGAATITLIVNLEAID